MPSQENNSEGTQTNLGLENTGRFFLGTTFLLIIILVVTIVGASIFALIYFFPMIFLASWLVPHIILAGGALVFTLVGIITFFWYLFRKEPKHLESTNNDYSIGKSARK